ncbi:hypothetical protein FJZ53_05985 [Candidatus Woesearchaeota archaeon]|nr:hypothetical protein [Candidatus Woesearchaeota archaeon]
MTKANDKKLEYRIFNSEEWDWFVAAKKDKKLVVLYEGHDLKEAYRSILSDMGIEVAIEERIMDSGSYIPKDNDFRKR